MRSLGNQTLAYAAGQILSRLQIFIVLFVLTRYLSPDQYGVLEVLTTTSFMLMIFAVLNLDSGISAYYYAEGLAERKCLVSTGLWINAIVGILLIFLLFSQATHLSRLLLGRNDFTYLFLLTVWNAVFRGMTQLHSILLRLKFQVWKYNILLIGDAVFSLAFSLLAVVVFDMGVEGVIYANMLVAILTTMLGIYFNRAEVLAPPKKRWISPLLQMGLPLVPFSAAAWILASADRTVLATYRGLTDVGIYGISARVAAIAGLVMGPFQIAWVPFALEAWTKPSAKALYTQVFRILLIGAGFAIVVLGLGGPIFIQVFIPSAYWDAGRYMGLLAMSNLMNLLYYFPMVSLMIEKKSVGISLAFGVGATLNMVLNFLWIPQFGVAGATWATVIGYGVMLVIVTTWAHRLLPIGYPYLGASGTLVVLFGLVSVPFFFTTSSISLMAVRMAVGAGVFIVACWVLGILRSDEIRPIFMYAMKSSNQFRLRFMNR